MADPLQHVAPGDPPPNRAVTYNLLFDAAKAHRDRKQLRAGQDGARRPLANAALEVWVRNDTGGTLAIRSVAALGTPVISAVDYPIGVQREPVFPGTAPADSSDVFAVLIEPIEDGKLGRAVVMGLAVCDVVVNDAGHEYAEPAASTTATLASAATGPARIVWRESGSSGTKRAVVLLGSDSLGTRVIPVELTSGYDGTTGYDWKRLQLDLGTPGFEDADPAETGDSAFTLDDDQDLESGQRGVLVKTDDGWTLLAEPPADPPTGSVTGPGWVAGLTDADCLSATAYAPLGGLGACSDLTAQTLHLINDGTGVWTTTVDFEYPTGSGAFTFWVEDGRPRASIGGIELVLDSAGVSGDAYYVDFAGGEGLGLCDGEHEACGSNTFIVRVQCEPCLTECCTDRAVPYTLYLTFSDGTGDAACLDGTTVAVNHRPEAFWELAGVTAWTSDECEPVCESYGYWTLQCPLEGSTVSDWILRSQAWPATEEGPGPTCPLPHFIFDVGGPLPDLTTAECDADSPLLLVFEGFQLADPNWVGPGGPTGTVTITVTETPPP